MRDRESTNSMKIEYINDAGQRTLINVSNVRYVQWDQEQSDLVVRFDSDVSLNIVYNSAQDAKDAYKALASAMN